MSELFQYQETGTWVRLFFWVFLFTTSAWYLHRIKRSRVGKKTTSIIQDESQRLSNQANVSNLQDRIDRRVGELNFFENIWFCVSTFVVLIVSAYLCFFFAKRPISQNAEEWGQLGDFFGGVLNPGLAFASFIALLYTIRIQSEELRITRDELAKSAEAQAQLVDSQNTQIKLQALLENYSSVKHLLITNLNELREFFMKENEPEAYTDYRSIRWIYVKLDNILIKHKANIASETYWDLISQDVSAMAGKSAVLSMSYSASYELAFIAKKQYERISKLAGAAESDYFHTSLMSYAELVSKYLVSVLLYRPKAPLGEEVIVCKILCKAIRETCTTKELPLPSCLKLSD